MARLGGGAGSFTRLRKRAGGGEHVKAGRPAGKTAAKSAKLVDDGKPKRDRSATRQYTLATLYIALFVAIKRRSGVNHG